MSVLASAQGARVLAQGTPSFEEPCKMPCFIYGVSVSAGVYWIDVCEKRWGLFPGSPTGYWVAAARHPDSLYLGGAGGNLAVWRIGSAGPARVIGTVPPWTVALTEDPRNSVYAGTGGSGPPPWHLWRVWPDNTLLGPPGGGLSYIGDLAYQYAPLYIPPIVGTVHSQQGSQPQLVDVARTGSQHNPRITINLGSLAYDGFDRLWGEGSSQPTYSWVYQVDRTTGAATAYMTITATTIDDFASTPRCLGQGPPEADADLGDAPDSSNHFAAPMTAYPGVQAAYPTVFDLATGSPAGHLHWFPDADHWLGSSVTKEFDADLLPDNDGLTNLEPPPDVADRDGGDNGVLFPIQLANCRLTSFQLSVTVAGPVADRYLNVWFDFDRDGQWGDELSCVDPDTGLAATVAEWAVANAQWRLGPGSHVLTTPLFRSLDVADSLWLRVTVSDEAASGAQGGGPPGGYEVGETEDYLLRPAGGGSYEP